MKKEHWLIPLLILVLWSILSYTKIVSQFFMATPSETFLRLYDLIISGEILKDIGWTLYRIFLGLLVGSIIGMGFGLLIGLVPVVWKYSQGTIDFFRSLPAFALFPFFILVFGHGDPAKIGTTAWFVAFIMLISTSYAIQDVNETRIQAAKSLGANRLSIFYRISMPDGLPQLLVGFRTCLSFAPIVVVATEMFSGTEYGIGDRIYEARLLYKVADMYASLIVAGIIGLILNKLFLYFVERKIHWSGR